MEVLIVKPQGTTNSVLNHSILVMYLQHKHLQYTKNLCSSRKE